MVERCVAGLVQVYTRHARRRWLLPAVWGVYYSDGDGGGGDAALAELGVWRNGVLNPWRAVDTCVQATLPSLLRAFVYSPQFLQQL